jgi:hypothetical protein
MTNELFKSNLKEEVKKLNSTDDKLNKKFNNYKSNILNYLLLPNKSNIFKLKTK